MAILSVTISGRSGSARLEIIFATAICSLPRHVTLSIYSTAAGYAVSGGRNGQTITKANLLVLLKQSAGKPFDLNEANLGATFGLCNIAPRRKVHDDALDFALATLVHNAHPREGLWIRRETGETRVAGLATCNDLNHDGRLCWWWLLV